MSKKTTISASKDTILKLKVLAKKKESVRGKLVVTAKQLAVIAKEKEDIRRKLVVTAETLRLKAKQLAATAAEKERVRNKLVITAKQLALTAKEKESANKYARSLIEAALDPLITISAQGKVTDVNEATIKVTGVSREKLIGTDFSNYFTEPTKAQEGYQKVLKEGQVKDYPLTIKSYGGKLVDVLYNATVYKDEAGNVLGVFAAARDITESKVLERTRDEFFAIASHELRTPLTAIRGNTELITQFFGKDLKNPEIKEMLSDIHSASIRLISLINDFLDVSRLEQGRVEMKLEKIDIAEIVEKTVKELKTVADGKGLSLVFDLQEKNLLVLANVDRIKQVLINIVSNAMNYTSKGGVTVKVIKSGKVAKIMVIDTGLGIAPDNQKLLFKKFSQAGADIYARDVSKGTGLGLYICKLILEKMGGEIDLEKSELGKGSTFSFTIPLAE